MYPWGVASIHIYIPVVRGIYPSCVGPYIIHRTFDRCCPACLFFATGPDGGAGWPNGDAIVSEERYHALRMIHGVGEG